jgi:anti-sigma B factor antagonist
VVTDGERRQGEAVAPTSPPGDLDVSVTSPRPDTVILHVAGDLDLHTAPVVAERFRSVLDDGDTSLSAFVLDLSGVTFLGSAGLGVLVDAHYTATARSVVLRVVASSRLVLQPIRLTGLDQLITIVPDLDTATG